MAWQGMAAEFLQVPAVTRTYTTACVLTTAAVVSRAGGSWSSSAPSSSTSIRTSCSGSYRSGGLSPTSSSSGPWDSASSSTCSSSAGAPGQPLLPGPGPHSYAGIRMEPPQPPGEGQLLRPPHLPGTIPALGAHGLLNAAGQLNPRGPPGDCCGPHLLLPGGCLPQPAWWQEAAADPWLPVSAEMTALPTHPQMVPYPMGEPLLAEAQCGPLPTGSCYWMPQRRTPITCPSSRSSQDPRSSDPTQGQGQPQGPIFPASGRPAFPPQPRLVAQLPVLEAGPCPGPTRINNDLHPLQTALALLPQPAIPFHAG
ncbi:derlin-3 isoform X3 [Kogia breviceps]|uniref:derlin-3 isoform X3 n=1 Tax=Kogia breviceps TaxID=27615 RepID=UPI0034D24DD6